MCIESILGGSILKCPFIEKEIENCYIRQKLKLSWFVAFVDFLVALRRNTPIYFEGTLGVFCRYFGSSSTFLDPGEARYQVKSQAQKPDGQKADIKKPIKQKAEMQKTDMSKSLYDKKPTIKKPIWQKADILLIFFSTAKSRYAKSRRSKSRYVKKLTIKKPICQKADILPLSLKQKADMQ
jgi:hypothetical protein